MTHAQTHDASALPPLVLASGSPRRRALLTDAGVPLVVNPSDADETWPVGKDLTSALLEVTHRKLQHLDADVPWALAADTIVALGDDVLGKPADAQAASDMLARLSGKSHKVMTGFVLMVRAQDGTRHTHAEAVTTEVWFRSLQKADIARYVATGDSLDKAGAYGIQSKAGYLIDRVQGSYTNIVGLPLTEVLAAMQALRHHVALPT